MSSKRHLRRKSCGDKRPFQTVKDAQTAAVLMFKRGGIRVRAYRCQFCRSYHVGHFGPHDLLPRFA